MPKFPHALRDWDTDSFVPTLKREIAALPAGAMPLEIGLAQGGQIDTAGLSVIVLGMSEEETCVRVKLGVFFAEVVGGCSCGDEPFSDNVYCEMLLCIDKTTAEGVFSPAAP